MSFALDALHAEVEPSWHSVRIAFFFQLDLIAIVTDLFDILNVPTLEVTLEGDLSDPYYATHTDLHFADVFIKLFVVDVVDW